MAKDPAFLLYSKDWLEGTADMTKAEKGMYIDLLCHQHQKGALPKEISRLARLAGLSEEQFLDLWEHVKHKFVPTENDRLVNRKLTDIITDRSTKSLTNRITGILASLIRLSPASPEIKEKIKKSFKIERFLTETNETVNQSVRTWFDFLSKSIENENGIENENVLGVGGMGEEGWNTKPGKKEIKLSLPEDKRTAAIELVKISKQIDLTQKEVDGLWSIFKTQNFIGEQFYQSKEKVYHHFINWIKNQNFNKNGTSTHQTGNNSKPNPSAKNTTGDYLNS